MNEQVVRIRGRDGKPVIFHLLGYPPIARPLDTSAEQMFRRQNPGR